MRPLPTLGVVAVLAGVLVTVAVPLAQGTRPRGAASPQEVVAVIRKAGEAKDFVGALPVIAPDGLREIASEGVTGVLMALAFSDPDDPMPGSQKPSAAALAAQKKRYQEAVATVRRTLQPYSLDGLIGKPVLAEETVKTIDAAIAKADNVALVTSLFGAMQKIAPLLGMKEGAGPPPPVTVGTVTGYKISGETATAQDGAATLNFVRIDGRWYITPPSTSGAPPASSPAAQAPAPRATASGTQPEIVVGGIQVVKAVVSGDDFSAKPFNSDNGTRIVLWIKMPANQGLIEIDEGASLLQHFGDDRGADLGGRFGSFPDEFKDGSGGTIDIESTGLPTAGATALVAEGTVAMTVATGTRKTRVAKVRLQNDQKFTLGKTPITIADVSTEGDSQSFTLKLPRQVMATIKDVAFFDAAGAPLEGRRTSSGYMNDNAEIGFSVKTTATTIALEFEVWQGQRTIKVPFKVKAGIALN